MARINLKNVVVDFPIVNASSQSLQLRLFQSLGGKLTSHHKTVVVRALDGVDLALGDGDRLGIIGHNGSGKTTLLRVLAGVYPPGQGSATIEGSISSFTDITLGMDPEIDRMGEHHLPLRLYGNELPARQNAVSPPSRSFPSLGNISICRREPIRPACFFDLPLRSRHPSSRKS